MAMQSNISDDVAAIARIAVIPKILRAAAIITGLRFTAIARVTESSWTACAVYDTIDFGLKVGGELELESTLCNEIRQSRQPIAFDQASLHPIYASHPTPKRYNFESYISIPIIRANGEFFGTLCALDPRPARLDDPHVLATLELFAQLIADELDREAQLRQVRDELADARSAGRLREQLMAVLGHDLRNPLQSVIFGAEALSIKVEDPAALNIVRSIQRSCNRMTELIANILDFARGSIGGGIPMHIRCDDTLGDELWQVIAEIRSVNPAVVIDAAISIDQPVDCDSRRIAQLFGNLLSNAVTHGDNAEPIRVVAKTHAEAFELWVQNAGPPISSEEIPRLFQPFKRGNADDIHEGLGLGLYICAEIARAQRGSLSLTSSAEAGTRFTFRMPLRQI